MTEQERTEQERTEKVKRIKQSIHNAAIAAALMDCQYVTGQVDKITVDKAWSLFDKCLMRPCYFSRENK
jgi:hypothetical protein